MKKSLGSRTILHPHPVLVIASYDKNENANMMTVSWAGICCSDPACIAISLRETTKTYHNLCYANAFTVNIPSQKFVKEVDYVGLTSGKEVDKFGKTGLRAVASSLVNAPYIEEFPYCLECKVISELNLGSHTLFIGQILDIKSDEDVLNDKGLPDIEKVKPLIYGSFASNGYYSVGDKVAPAFFKDHLIK